MAIRPVYFEIPADIEAQLAIGDLVLYGGVVRDPGGRIVKHLREIALPDADDVVGRAGAITKKLTQSIHLTDLRLIAGAIVVGVVAIGGTVYYLSRKSKRPRPGVPEPVTNYNAALTSYIKAVQDGSLDAEIIERLISALDAGKEYADDGRIVLDSSTEQAEQLVNLVIDYTKQLTQANSVEFGDLEEHSLDSDESPIIDMRRYLDVQRKIFNDVA